MNPDIRIEISFKGHRKRRKLQTLLGPGSTDYLIDLWIGSALSRPEGTLHGYDELDIATEAGWGGDPREFVDALVKVGFLDVLDNGAYALHDWAEHQPFVVKTKEREEHARKASNARWSKKSSPTKTTRGIPAGSSEHPPNTRKASSSHSSCIPEASSGDTHRILEVSSEHGASLPDASSKNAPSMPLESAEHSPGTPTASSENPHRMPDACSEHSASMPRASSKNPARMPGESTEHPPSIPEASPVDAQHMLDASSGHARCNAQPSIRIPPPSNMEDEDARERVFSASAPTANAPSMPGASSEHAQPMLDASSEHARWNAPTPIPIPIISYIDSKDVSESMYSASAPGGAVLALPPAADEIAVEGGESHSPEIDADGNVEDVARPAEDLSRAPPRPGVATSPDKGDTGLPVGSRAVQEIPVRDMPPQSSGSIAHPDSSSCLDATATGSLDPPPGAPQEQKLKKHATERALPSDFVHETAPNPASTTPIASAVSSSADAVTATTPKVYLSKRKRKLTGWKLEAFEEFYEAFALKKGRAEAADAWLDIPNLSPELAAAITEAAKKEAVARPSLISNNQTPKWAQGWLSGRRWEDWEEGGGGAHNQDNAAGREVKDDAKASPSRRDEESRYHKSIDKAFRRFL